MRRISALSRQILAQNAGRDVDRLTLKLEHLRQDPFAFFRGTNPLFLSFLPRGHSLFRAPCTYVCGDLHLENFGAYKGDNRLCYFDINDFDEACLAPCTVDIVRFMTGVHLAAKGLGFNRGKRALLTKRFLAAYTREIANGKPRWIERSLARGVFRDLLRRAMRRTRGELLNRYSKMSGGRRRLRIGIRALALTAAERARLDRFAARLKAAAPERHFFDLVDAAHRIAGNGSLGLERYMLLVRGRGTPDQNFVLDVKFAAPSAVAAWWRARQPPWPDDAARVVAVQRIMQAIAPAMLHAVEYRGRQFVLKELQPSIDRLDITQWREKPRRLAEAIEGMGRVAAWAHLRGCGHQGSASVEGLQAYVAGKRWAEAAERLAESAAAKVDRAWRTYSEDYDAGRIAAAVARRSAGPAAP
jgi:uncharacterized protein (DUF2252 family)